MNMNTRKAAEREVVNGSSEFNVRGDQSTVGVSSEESVAREVEENVTRVTGGRHVRLRIEFNRQLRKVKTPGYPWTLEPDAFKVQRAKGIIT